MFFPTEVALGRTMLLQLINVSPLVYEGSEGTIPSPPAQIVGPGGRDLPALFMRKEE